MLSKVNQYSETLKSKPANLNPRQIWTGID